MNLSLELTKKEELMWPTPIIAGALTIVLNDKDHLLLPSHSSISIEDGINKSIFIDKCIEPLVIDCRSTKTIELTIKEKADVSLLIHTQLANRLKINLKAGSKANIYLLGDATQKLEMLAEVGEKAHLKIFDIKTSKDMYESIINVHLIKPEAEVDYLALDVLSGNAHKSTALTIYHGAQMSRSSQCFRGIYGGSSFGNFLGKVVVEKQGAKSKATQLYRSVILSPKAKAHTKPQLEIYNYDISASHGASIGELDKNALFYLCSRGISLEQARALLLNGLINDVLEQMEPDFKKLLSSIVDASAQKVVESA